MHKKTAKRNTCNLLIQNTKASDKFSSIREYKNNDNESSEHFQLPSLQKKKTWKDVNNQVSTWDESSNGTICTSSLTELEDTATAKVVQQWDAIENTLYEDGNQVIQTALLEECTQWRKQIPHLRIVGKNPFLPAKTKYENLGRNSNQSKTNLDSFNDEILPELSQSIKEKKTSSKHKLQSTLQDKILNMLFDYVVSELLPSKENEIEKDFDKVSQVRMAPIHSNKSSARSTKMTWFEETIPLDNTFSSGRDKLIEDHIIPLKKETIHANLQENQKKYDNLKYNNGTKNGQDNTFSAEDKFLRPHTSRNKLGTVFNEKIVVSPVPYILSTRESFSTIKTTPIKFMEQPLNVSTFQGNSLTPTKYSSYQSAWHATVSPAVWSKNIKLAPLDTSRLPSSKNRSLTSSSVVLQRNKKPLSPISRSTPPVSAQTIHNNTKCFEIQGRHISSGQSSKLSVINTGSDHSTKNSKNKKKRSQSKTKL
ncbi:uncharacterized protein LOC116426671 isoform X2 [Nomia melanderi]|uniref:uncharacterized protein LOC116426671 isoform X2 n=1 Tax=Nomia melanderi TaxID=2448451 RepID=UPI0013041100|nr:uncharacterized protein LOC116426671 isoform X2 [Nomia melanderi]